MMARAVALQGAVRTTVAPQWHSGASQAPGLSVQQQQQQSSSSEASAGCTPQGMSVGLGLGPAGLEIIRSSMSRELGGFSYNDLWAASQLQQQGPGSPHPYGAGLLNPGPALAASYSANHMCGRPPDFVINLQVLQRPAAVKSCSQPICTSGPPNAVTASVSGVCLCALTHKVISHCGGEMCSSAV